MVGSSLESLLKRVDRIASALAGTTIVLPEGLNEQKRREDIMTLNLLRVMDRLRQPVIVVETTTGAQSKSSRKASIWEQGTVPRNGGR